MNLKIDGSVQLTLEDGEVIEFEIKDLNSLYSAANQINRRINVDWHVMDFIDEMVQVTKEPSDLVQGTELAELFKGWMEGKGHEYVGGRNALYRHVGVLHGVRRVTGTNKVGFRGIRVLGIKGNGKKQEIDDLI